MVETCARALPNGTAPLTPQQQHAEAHLQIQTIEAASSRLKAAIAAGRSEFVAALHNAIDTYVLVQSLLRHLGLDANHRNPVLRALAALQQQIAAFAER